MRMAARGTAHRGLYTHSLAKLYSPARLLYSLKGYRMGKKIEKGVGIKKEKKNTMQYTQC